MDPSWQIFEKNNWLLGDNLKLLSKLVRKAEESNIFIERNLKKSYHPIVYGILLNY